MASLCSKNNLFKLHGKKKQSKQLDGLHTKIYFLSSIKSKEEQIQRTESQVTVLNSKENLKGEKLKGKSDSPKISRFQILHYDYLQII